MTKPSDRRRVVTDDEIRLQCAHAMGYVVLGEYPDPRDYDPLTDDAQAMALVKKFRLHPIPDHDREGWWDVFAQGAGKASVYGSDPDLNRAVCECVAKLKQGECE